MTVSKVLIANRGEIALRIIRACRDLDLRTVAVYSEADAETLPVRFADEALCIGPAPSSESYLNIPALISAAEISGCDAVHPGYGFMSENAEFAEVCERCGLTFIGPSPEVIQLMGNKVAARRAAVDSGLSILPGSGVLDHENDLIAATEQIGYPIIIKASAGGGGRGMKIVEDRAQLVNSWSMARREAEVGFGCPDVYIERYVRTPRHIEFQVMCDTHGNAIHLGERECSIQRRHQKLVEEALSPAMDADRRAELGAAVVRTCKAIGYRGAGTFEFLMDEDGRCYFMEMNTRIQVEHTVTEEITGVDLVREQLLVAQGEKLSVSQNDIRFEGHAIECRINAEDPDSFAPWPGKITALHMPGGPGVRMDTALYSGYEVPKHYDSMIAKLIVRGSSRQEAIRRLRRALAEFVVEGIRTNVPLYQRIVSHADFVEGRLDTRFLERLAD